MHDEMVQGIDIRVIIEWLLISTPTPVQNTNHWHETKYTLPSQK